MKVVIPLARIENAYKRSENYNPLLEVAGKPLIGHLIDQVNTFKPEEIIFIVGGYEKKIIAWVKEHNKTPSRFILQKNISGNAHAIYGAKPFIHKDILILFSDTLMHPKSLQLPKNIADGNIWVSDVRDPTALGVVFKDGNYASKLIEKPDEPISTQVMVGMYYLKEANQLFDNIKYLLDNKITTKGEYHLADALQLMINKGAKISTTNAKEWVDVDATEGLSKGIALLTTLHKKNQGTTKNSLIMQPCTIGKGAIITGSIIGPHVSIAQGAHITGSIIRESVVGKEASVQNATLTHSVIGVRATVKGHYHHMNVANEGKSHID